MPPAVQCVAPEPHRPGAHANVPPGGACGLPVQAGLGRSAKPFTRRINKATSPFTRRTTSAVSAAAARCRGRVRTPMPLRGACGLPVQAGLGQSAKPFTKRTNKATSPFTRRTTSAVSAANECEGITCLWQVTRNGSDEAERRERSPSGVVSAANVEELAAAGGQVSGEAAPASGSALQPDRPSPPARGSGGRARRPPEPSAGRRCGTHYPPGTLPVLDAMQSRV